MSKESLEVMSPHTMFLLALLTVLKPCSLWQKQVEMSAVHLSFLAV